MREILISFGVVVACCAVLLVAQFTGGDGEQAVADSVANAPAAETLVAEADASQSANDLLEKPMAAEANAEEYVV